MEEQPVTPAPSPIPTEPQTFTPPPLAPEPPASPVVSPEPVGPPAPAQQFGGPPPQAPMSNSTSASTFNEYISNPFLNSVRGLTLILQNNPVSAMLSGFIGLAVFFVMYIVGLVGGALAHSPILIFIGFLVAMLVLGITFSAYAVIGGASAREEQITTSAAFSKAFSHIIQIIGFTIVYGVIVSIGFVLLIIPGIILASRGSLGLLIIFEENLGPIAALKRSFELTKGHVVEMIGAVFASSFLSGGGYGLLTGAIGISPLVGRYHDLVQLKESGAQKPPIHWLNYVAFVLTILIFVGTIAFVALGISSGINNLSKVQSTPNSYNFNQTYNTSTDPSSSSTFGN